ncbi:MAG: site-specific integrase [Actinomycetales bacterium]|nr:site-specific integrase [Actinomycetales bacterium]
MDIHNYSRLFKNMATLEFINYTPYRHTVINDGEVIWECDPNLKAIKSLPMIFWADGVPWHEVNHWAHERATSGNIELKTVQDQMRHLHKFAEWLELPESPDWRHFPMSRADRVLIKWRKYLIDLRDKFSILAPTSTTARMNACISFYRHCSAFGLIDQNTQKWTDTPVVIKYHDTAGFERTLSRITTDVSIKCKVTNRTTVEEGLLPITGEHMRQLLAFARLNCTQELFLMLKLGFFTGARVQTICDLRVSNLDRAVPDPDVADLWRIAVGPGSQPHVKTKFDVSGNLLIPEQLLNEIKDYAYSIRRMKRVAQAPSENKDLLFITTRGNPYERKEDGKRSSAINSEMVILRHKARSAGLKFMDRFHFHQTRATYGTQLMKTLLPMGNLQAALEFVRNAMFHKEVSTTMKYIKFIEHTKRKIEVANAYTQVFLGLSKKIGNEGA